MVTISCRTRVANGRAQPRPTSAHGLAYELLFGGQVLGTRAESPLAGQAVAGLVVDGLILVLVAVSWLRTRTMPS